VSLKEYFWKKDGIEVEDDGSNGTAAKGLSVEERVKGGDFTGAGAAASKIKQLLKKLPISPQTVRRVAIASYEAEINVVAHADGGNIIAFVSPDNVKVVIADRLLDRVGRGQGDGFRRGVGPPQHKEQRGRPKDKQRGGEGDYGNILHIFQRGTVKPEPPFLSGGGYCG
jgi:anti-sigma regulatory factor (Ser/Thr protein kinase)